MGKGAQVSRPPLLLGAQLVTTFAAVGNTLQQGLAFARHAPASTPFVLCVIVSQHGLNALEFLTLLADPHQSFGKKMEKMAKNPRVSDSRGVG